jgi:prevent-host-death family protein
MPVRKINIVEDIVPIGEFKTHASQLLRRMRDTRSPLVITQNGRPSAVVITPEEFEELGYREFVRAKVRAGIVSAERGRTVSAATLRNRLRARVRKARER